MNLTRYKENVGIAMLDEHIETLGEKGLLSMIVDKLSRGMRPSDVCHELEIPFMVLWEWLEADPKRQRMYNAGQEMYAQELHAEVIGIADSATVEEVALARLRTDVRFKAASNYDKKRFGNQPAMVSNGFNGGVTIVIGDIKSGNGNSENVIDVIPEAITNE